MMAQFFKVAIRMFRAKKLYALINIVALSLAIAIAIPVGVLAATRPYSLFDQVANTFAFIGFSLPTFFTGILLILVFFADLGAGHAVLPAFILGLCMSRYFGKESDHHLVIRRLRTVAYALVTPVFFLVGGLRISFPMIAAGLLIFVLFFALKIAAKFLGVYFLARKFIPHGSMYTTLLMSTGLTFGTISSLYGLQAGIITQSQYSILVGVVVASAVIPTVIAQKWFRPVEDEDILDE